MEAELKARLEHLRDVLRSESHRIDRCIRDNNVTSDQISAWEKAADIIND